MRWPAMWLLALGILLANTGAFALMQYGPAAGVAGSSGCTVDVPGASGVFQTEINNTYVFNNTRNGTLSDMGPGTLACGVAENKNYWNTNPACTATGCAVGIGRGTTAPTGPRTPAPSVR